MYKKFLFVLLASLCAASPTLAQTQSDDVVRITTNLVQIDAVVTKNRKPVSDLKAEDFEIFEDGKRQEITSFAYISNVADSPATSAKSDKSENDRNAPPVVPGKTDPPNVSRRMIALVVDDYGLSAQSMSEVRGQLREFIDKQLDPHDLIAIILTSRARRELPNFTNDKSRINQAWEQLKWNQCSRVGVKTMPRIGSDATVGCGTATFDESISSLRAVLTALGHVPGRKSIIIFSDDTPLRENERLVRSSSVLQANDAKSKEALNYRSRLRRLAELAIRSSVVIYAVDTGGLQVTHMTAADSTLRPNVAGSEGNALLTAELRGRAKLIQARRDSADMLTKETGGFMIHDQNEFQFDKILADQSGYYLIGYRPSTETFNKRFHKIRARVKKSGYDVRTRSGFFGVSEEEAKRLKQTTDK